MSSDVTVICARIKDKSTYSIIASRMWKWSLTCYYAPAGGYHEHKLTIFTTELTTVPGAVLAALGDFGVQCNVECVSLCGRQTGIRIYMKCG